MKGYEPELFLKKPHQDFICAVCECVFNECVVRIIEHTLTNGANKILMRLLQEQSGSLEGVGV
jgi:hypothetical protein